MARKKGDSDQEISTKSLMKVASELDDEWEMVGRNLGLSESLIDNIKSDNSGKQAEQKLQMLLKWRKVKGTGATFGALNDAVAKVHSLSLAHGGLTTDKYSMLVKALKEVYRRRYSGVKPIPFLYDTWRCVNDIFVENEIQVLDNSKTKKDPTRWSSIKSRHEIFTKPTFEKHITIAGEPGFGKSTLLLQYSYDWGTSSTESPLNNSYIFILLRLKDVRDTPNVYDAIKMMLPEDLPITREDIKEIVTSGQWKVVLALDGYDEYSGIDNTSSDINKIIEGRMLTACIIIITTRPSCQPKLQSPTVTHCKLTGFDQGMQEEYIDKAITSQAASRDINELIMRKLKENVVLSDICQVPLFLATFAHMNTIGAEYQKLNSVTSYFSFMLASFFGHFANKAKGFGSQFAEEEPMESSAYRLQIAKLAFDGLISKEQNLLWLQDDLLKLLSPSCYEQYISAGILLKEQKRTFKVVSGSHADNRIEVKTYVQFFHKTFQEYYAAHYISHLAETQNADALKETLSKFDLYNYQYVMRFACGLNPKAAQEVQDYLTNLGQDGREFSILCTREQETRVADSTIAHLCTEGVNFTLRGSRLLQRSTIHVLQTASEREIPISSVKLSNCFQSVDLKEECLCISSDLQLPRLDTLQKLVIDFSFTTKDLRDQARDILDYSARCVGLKSLKFSFVGVGVILLPRIFHDKDALARLYRKKCKVEWKYKLLFRGGENLYGNWSLNFQSGKWENEEDEEMTDLDYQRVVKLHEDSSEDDEDSSEDYEDSSEYESEDMNEHDE